MDVLEAMQARRSVRAFLEKDVSDDTLTKLLATARWAPSGVNTQPWQVIVVKDPVKQQLSSAILQARDAEIPPNPDYRYYPDTWYEPYKARRRACGLALYSALDISREDTERRRHAWNRNYTFFGAPVGLFVIIDSRLEKGSWMDIGMFLQNIMLAAVGFGLATCPQAAMAEFPDVVREVLALESTWHIVCGVAIGYEDSSAVINQYRTEREPVEAFTRWYTHST